MIGIKWAKKFFCLSLIATQIVALGQAHKALSIVTNKDYTWRTSSFQDSEDLKAKIIQDPEFIKSWASMAHMLGFAWCGGTGNPIVGEDFVFKRGIEKDNKGTDHEVYYLIGNYNSSDNCAKKARADERLRMIISNVRLVIEPTTLKFGTPKMISMKFNKIASAVLENTSDEDRSTSIFFDYVCNKNWSRIDNFKLNEKIDAKTKFSVDMPLSEDKETKLNVEFGEEQGWESLEGTTISKINEFQYNSKVPAKCKIGVELLGFEKNLEIPYEAKVYIEYDITLTGFLRGSENGNGHIDHPTHRPTKSITFGGRNGLNAAEDLFDQYSNRDIEGYSEWDWQWITTKFSKENIEYYIKEICKVKRGREITGVFKTIEGIQIATRTFDLKSTKTMIRDNSLSKGDKVEVKDYKAFETPGFTVKRINTNR